MTWLSLEYNVCVGHCTLKWIWITLGELRKEPQRMTRDLENMTFVEVRMHCIELNVFLN